MDFTSALSSIKNIKYFSERAMNQKGEASKMLSAQHSTAQHITAQHSEDYFNIYFFDFKPRVSLC
jgi:hypothetical protein